MAVISAQSLNYEDFGVWQQKLLFESEESFFHISQGNGNLQSMKKTTSFSSTSSRKEILKKKSLSKERKSNSVQAATFTYKEQVSIGSPFGVWQQQLSYAQAETYFYLPRVIAKPIEMPPKHSEKDELSETQHSSEVEDKNKQECNFANGVWLRQLAFLQAETQFYSKKPRKSRSGSRRRKKSPVARPFALTRPPPITLRLVEAGNAVNNTDNWSQILETIKKTDQQTAQETQFRVEYVALLNGLIVKHDEVFKDARLEIFGSTKNGFGHSNGDLDLVLNYPNPNSGASINKTNADLVNILAKIFRKPDFFNVIRVMQVIRSARVPIIKFVSASPRHPGLSGDICIRNCLGPRNTKLMWSYAKYDERFRTLGYGIKKFAKLANINDASSGSLSSYAYLLMMIYYLQRTTPPVLPCLQNIYLSIPGEVPVREENDMNTWYQEDLDYVKGMCGKLRNLQTVGSLWMGFFRFYCEFPFREQIDITTRRNPTVRRVAVEIRDPFDEDHDLARVLRLQGENLIRNCFHSALELFNRIEFLQPDLTDASKLAFFEWIVEQVENSHPFEKMTTCWTCGHGDHYKSVCEVYAQRRKERELEEGNEEASGGGKDNRDGDSNDKARRKRPTRRNQNDGNPKTENKESNRGTNIDRKGGRPKPNHHLNPRNGMKFHTAPIVNHNNRNTYQQHFNGVMGPSLQKFPLMNIGNQVPMMPPYGGHIQSHLYGGQVPQQLYNPQQFNRRNPQMSHQQFNNIPNTSGGYITPRFMTDPQFGGSSRYQNTPLLYYTNAPMREQRPTYQNIGPGIQPNQTNSQKERSYGRNKNKTFPDVPDSMSPPKSIRGRTPLSNTIPNLIDAQLGEPSSSRYPPRQMRMPQPQQTSNYAQIFAQIPPESYGNQRNINYF